MPRATVAEMRSTSASTSAWVVAGIANPVANRDMTPINAPWRQ